MKVGDLGTERDREIQNAALQDCAYACAVSAT
jgi:hypothetical protein